MSGTTETILDEIKKEQEKQGKQSSTYAKRVKRWWNSKLHGTVRKAEIEGPERVLCTVTEKETGRIVVQADGKKSKKRSAHGAARAKAVSMLFSNVAIKCNVLARRLPNLDAYEFTYKKLEG